MAKATGIEIGASFIRFVELDGSSRKFKIAAVHRVPRELVLAAEGEENLGHMAPRLGKEIEEAAKTAAVSKERCLLSVRGADCILRNLKVPFRGRDEIHKVLKFEAESAIHSHSIDEVVVDAVVTSEGAEETELFIAACPKEKLGREIHSLQRAGFDPEVADLDCHLLYNAASYFDLHPRSDADASENQAALGLIVDIGQASIQLILSRDGEFVTSRVLRFGLESYEAALSSRRNIPRESVHRALNDWFHIDNAPSSNGAAESEDADDFVVLSEEGDSLADEARSAQGSEHPALEIEDLMFLGEELATRLRSEVFRFLTGARVPGELRKIYLSGGGAEIPQITESCAEQFGVEVEKLDLIGRSGAGESDPGLECAFAAAMAAIGCFKVSLNFRQENLAFKRKFERLKVPIAVAIWCFAIFLLVSVKNLRRANLEYDEAVGAVIPSKSGRQKYKYPVYSGLLLQLAHPVRKNSHLRLRVPDQKDADHILAKLAKTPLDDRVNTLYAELRNLKRKLEKATGYFPELRLESGLAVLQAFSALVEEADKAPDIGRFLILKIDLNVGSNKGNRKLQFTVAFRGEDFRAQSASFQRICRDSLGKNDSPFEEFKVVGSESLFKDTDGAELNFQFKLKDQIGVFQPTKFQ